MAYLFSEGYKAALIFVIVIFIVEPSRPSARIETIEIRLIINAYSKVLAPVWANTLFKCLRPFMEADSWHITYAPGLAILLATLFIVLPTFVPTA